MKYFHDQAEEYTRQSIADTHLFGCASVASREFVP